MFTFISDLFRAHRRVQQLETLNDRLRNDLDFAIAELRVVRAQLTTQRLVAQNVTVPSDQEHSFAERYAYLRNNFTMHNITHGYRNTGLEGYGGMKFQWTLPGWDPKDPTPEQFDRQLDKQIERHKSMLKDKTHERK